MDKETIVAVVGEWYDSQPTVRDSNKGQVQSAYNHVADVNSELFDQIPIPVVFQDEDPYDSYEEMAQTVGNEQQLRIFSGGNNPTFLSEKENLVGRAVHDFHGHLTVDCDFSIKGEFQKWDHMRHEYDRDVHSLLFTEVVGQRIAASYYEDGFFDDSFEQKAVFAPQHIMTLVRQYVQE